MPRLVYNCVPAGVRKVEDFFKEGNNCVENPSAATDQKWLKH